MGSNKNIISYEKQFDEIRLMIENHRRRAYHTANYEQIATYWEVGRYVSNKLKTVEWGSKIVTNLALYLKEKQPDIKGFDRRAIYRIVQFYDTYSTTEFAEVLQGQLPEPEQVKQIVGIETPQLQNDNIQGVEIMGFQSPQFENTLLKILAAINWSSHLEILSGCTTDEERLYYIFLTYREKLFTKELARKVEIGDYENPSIGILLCKNADSETVEYALSRSLSPTMIAKYKQQLLPKEELQKLLKEYHSEN
jgi:hypothetical protein